MRNANVNLPTGILYGPLTSFTVQASGQILSAAGYRPVIVAYRNGSPVRLGDLGQVIDSVENDKAAAWYNDERVDLARDLQAARHEHRRGRRGGPQAPPDLPEAASGLGVAPRPLRPVGVDPRVGRRREVHAAADARPRRPRDLPLPAQPLGDGHPEPRAAVLDRRHLRRDVRARLQPRQPLAHGAHALGRLRRRRRDRHAREHRPAHRARRGRRSRPRSRARARSASRSSR